MTNQAPVVQKVDNTIHRINHYPLDSAIDFAMTYPQDSDLSGGQHYPSFEQLGPCTMWSFVAKGLLDRSSGYEWVTIGHYRVNLSLHFKARLSAKSLLWKSVFIHIEIRTNYHNKNLALRLALKDRLRRTRKWPICMQIFIKTRGYRRV